MNKTIEIKKILLPLLLIALVSCSAGLTSDSQTPVTTNLFKTMVIDGYIQGANTFIDFNFNLTQDEGEPSATFNSTDNLYYFTESDFSAIDNFTEACGMNRPRVAEIPVGAMDSTRGLVNNAYTMMFFPHDGGSPIANVTPFTTMLTDSINEKLSNDISVANGCDTKANQLAQDIKSELNILLSNLEQNFEISRDWFYEDFIASGDTIKQSIGEKIVDFLSTLHAVEGLLKDTHNMGFRGMISDEVVALILNNSEFDSVTFEIQNETASIQEDEHFRYQRRHNFYNLRVNSQGQLLDSQGTPIEITIKNLEDNSTVYVTENYEECCDENKQLIIANHRIHISIEERKEVGGVNWNKTFIRFLPADNQGPVLEYSVDESARYVMKIESETSFYESFELQIRDSLNTYFDLDLPSIMSTRYPTDLQKIYTDLTAIDMTMAGIQNNLYLLYSGGDSPGDVLRIESGSASKGHQWIYRFGRYRTSDQENCEQRDFSDYSIVLQEFSGVEAFNTCSDNM